MKWIPARSCLTAEVASNAGAQFRGLPGGCHRQWSGEQPGIFCNWAWRTILPVHRATRPHRHLNRYRHLPGRISLPADKTWPSPIATAMVWSIIITTRFRLCQLRQAKDVMLHLMFFLAGGCQGSSPSHFYSAAPPSVQGGSFVRLPIELGTAYLPVSDLYGVAFSLNDLNLVDANSVEFNLSQASWANPDNDRIWFYKRYRDTKIDVAWVRTDRNTKEGFGGMGYVDFVIIVDLLPFQQQKSVSLQNIKMMDNIRQLLPVVG